MRKRGMTTLIADSEGLSDNHLGLATVILIYGEFTNGKPFVSVLYATTPNLRLSCHQKTYQLQLKAKRIGKEINFAEYTLYTQHRIGTRAARDDLQAAMLELSVEMPGAMLLRGKSPSESRWFTSR